MINRHKTSASLWLCFFLAALSGACLFYASVTAHPMERALGLAHCQIYPTDFGPVLSCDNLGLEDLDKLGRSHHIDTNGKPSTHLYFLAFSAVVFSAALGFLIRDGVQELWSLRQHKWRTLLWLCPLGVGAYLCQNGAFAALFPLGFALCFGAFAVLLARSRPGARGFRFFLSGINVFFLLWLGHLAGGTFQDMKLGRLGWWGYPFESCPWTLLLVTAWTLWPISRISYQTSWLKGNADSEISIQVWMMVRQASLLLSLGVTAAASRGNLNAALSHFAGTFALPLGLMTCVGLCLWIWSRGHREPLPRLSAVSRLASCTVFFFSPFLIYSVTWAPISTIAKVGASCFAVLLVLLVAGRPWGSRRKRRSSLGDNSHSKEPRHTDFRICRAAFLPGLSTLGLSAVLARWAYHRAGWASFGPDLSFGTFQDFVQLWFVPTRVAEFGGELFLLTLNPGTGASTSLVQGPGNTLYLTATWVESLSWLLALSAGTLLSGLLMLWTNYGWDARWRAWAEGDSLVLFSSVFGAYGLAGLLGWHWVAAMPFLLIYLLLATASLWLRLIPTRTPSLLGALSQNRADPAGRLQGLALAEILQFELWVGAQDQDGLQVLQRELGALRIRLVSSLELEAGEGQLHQGGRYLGPIKLPLSFADAPGLLGFRADLAEQFSQALCYDSVKHWIGLVTAHDRALGSDLRTRQSVGTVQALLKELVSRGHLVTDPDPILGVLLEGTEDLDELLESCLKLV